MKVEVSDLRKTFAGDSGQRVPALDGVSLSVRQGEFLALLGPSGSGKTTLLRVLAGLEFVDSGQVLIGGRPMDAVPARERGVGLVFQNYALFRHRTVARNVSFGLEVRPRAERPSRSAIAVRVGELLQMMGLDGLGGRYPEQLSGGQRQRVALARALAIEPELLLLDEPFGALDAKVRKSLRVWLRELHDRMGLTSIFVTHDQAEAMEMADRVAVLRAGRIEQVDTPGRLYDEPSSVFVHEFLGESVRLDCTVAGGLARFDALALPDVPTACPAGPAIALIRPQEIGLSPPDPIPAGPIPAGPIPAGLAGEPARVLRVRPAGPMWRIGLRVGEQELEALLPAGGRMPAAGEDWGIDLSRARIYPAR